jgi:curved DNA-binding protein CbpA
MRINMRRVPRRRTNAGYAISWQDAAELTHSAEVIGVDVSATGLRIQAATAIEPGTRVYIQGHDYNLCGHCAVRHCAQAGDRFEIGMEFAEDIRHAVTEGEGHDLDYYEFLQISPRAEFPTIQRIYRFMASRFHPDNPETGDAEKFLLLNRSYAVLSDPERRAAYDASRETVEVQTNPIFELREFVNGIEGEMNRRLGVLSLLYNQRRTNPENPRVSLYDLEKRMGWPREYLDFTTWYLRSKQLVTREDNSDFSLTAMGVDYVESNYTQIPILQKLLNSGARTATSSTSSAGDDPPAPSELYLMGSAGTSMNGNIPGGPAVKLGPSME